MPWRGLLRRKRLWSDRVPQPGAGAPFPAAGLRGGAGFGQSPLTRPPHRPYLRLARRAGWPRRSRAVEESPDSLKQRCRVTPGRGNPTESATENRLPSSGAEKVKRWGKSPPRPWQQGRHGKPHREQCRIGPPRGPVPERQLKGKPPLGPLQPRGVGLAAGGAARVASQMNGHRRGQPLNKIRLTGPPRMGFSRDGRRLAGFCARQGRDVTESAKSRLTRGQSRVKGRPHENFTGAAVPGAGETKWRSRPPSKSA